MLLFFFSSRRRHTRYWRDWSSDVCSFRSHLQTIAECPSVTMRIIPFRHGLYPYHGLAYILLEFPDPADEYVVYMESAHGPGIIRENAEEGGRDTPTQLLEAFWEIEQITSHEETMDLFQDATERLMGEPSAHALGVEAIGTESNNPERVESRTQR